MSEELVHVPVIITDNEHELYFVKCGVCGKVLWYPQANDACNPPPPALGINITEGIGTKDIFG